MQFEELAPDWHRIFLEYKKDPTLFLDFRLQGLLAGYKSCVIGEINRKYKHGDDYTNTCNRCRALADNIAHLFMTNYKPDKKLTNKIDSFYKIFVPEIEKHYFS